MPKNKFKIRLLPIFIFVAALTLSIKINNAYDLYKSTQSSVSISTNRALAEEAKSSKETAELTDVLQKGVPANAEAAPAGAFTNSEIMILQELAERREALDARAKEIDKRAIQLKVAEKEIDKKLQQMKEYEQRLSKLITRYSTKEQENINSLVKLYSSMKPKDAARIFNTMDLDITVAILKGMKPSTSSAILSSMSSERVQAITAELIGNNI